MRKSIGIAIASLAVFGCTSDNQTKDNSASAVPQSTQKSLDTSSTGQKRDTAEMTIQYEMSGIPFDLSGKPVSIAGITYTPAIQWKDLGASDMKAASYSYGPLEKDKEPANLSVFFFGPNQGGTIEANVQRWINQMSMPDGGNPSKAAVRYTMDVNGMPTHVLTLYGTFNESMGGPMSQKTIPRENYRLIGVIVEAPEGNVFFKLTGPDYTAKIMVEAFMAMVKQIQKVA